MPADRLPSAIGDLDPGNRALLDLSLRRGVSDAEIGELLRKEPVEVARGRDAVLELLADALDVGGHDRRERVREAVAALPDEAWAAPVPAAPASPPAPPPLPEEPEDLDEDEEEEEEPPEGPVVMRPPQDREGAAASRVFEDEFKPAPPPKRSRKGAVLAGLGILAVIIALIVLLAGGDDEPDGGDSGGSPSGQNGGPAGDTQELNPVNGKRGSGTVEVTDEGATITVRGLPDPKGGVYGIWLYDNVVSAEQLGTLPDGSGELEVRLPGDASDYRFLDVSLEPQDGNPNHSGDSVLRAPLDELLAE
ncbi:MAG: anti-sigma factor [Thermoleophilaceae bacterium]